MIMKRLLLSAIFILISFSASSQEIITFNGKSYEKKGVKWYDENDFEINNRVITIRLKDNMERDVLEGIGKKIRENILGYIDIEIPSDDGFFVLMDSLNKHPNIESVDINTYGVYSFFQVTPNDPQYTNQWYINQVEINNAWEATMGNSCILVGVLDSGLDWMHEDLGIGQDLYQNIWLNPGEDI